MHKQVYIAMYQDKIVAGVYATREKAQAIIDKVDKVYSDQMKVLPYTIDTGEWEDNVVTKDKAIERYLYDSKFRYVVDHITASLMKTDVTLDDIQPAVELAVDKYKKYRGKKT